MVGTNGCMCVRAKVFFISNHPNAKPDRPHVKRMQSDIRTAAVTMLKCQGHSSKWRSDVWSSGQSNQPILRGTKVTVLRHDSFLPSGETCLLRPSSP